MSSAAPLFPPVRACLFDMDGLLLNTEDLYTLVANTVLAKYGKPKMPWSLKAQLQGLPGPIVSIYYAMSTIQLSG
jgi:pseudouridine-5'-monophosphatase